MSPKNVVNNYVFSQKKFFSFTRSNTLVVRVTVLKHDFAVRTKVKTVGFCRKHLKEIVGGKFAKVKSFVKMFPTLRKTAKVKPDATKLMRARTMGIIYYPSEPLGFRFRLRNLSSVEGWNATLKASGCLNYPLTQSARLQGYTRKKSPSEVFLVFATLRKDHHKYACIKLCSVVLLS